MDGRYSKYNCEIPAYLANRPHHFVKHCMMKIQQANQSDLSGIVIKGQGEFVVHSFTHKWQHYKVSFGDEETMPKCSCPDFNRSKYICKHFFAIFKKYPEAWSWDALSSLYRNSVFLTIDDEVDYDTNMNINIIKSPATEDDFHLNNLDSDVGDSGKEDTLDVGSKDFSKQKCNSLSQVRYDTMTRDVLTQIGNISHDLDLTDNKELYESLVPILKFAEMKRKRERNLPLLPKTSKNLPKYLSLSLNRKKNSNKRVGEKAEIEAKAKLIKVKSEKEIGKSNL